jgi:putative transposase
MSGRGLPVLAPGDEIRLGGQAYQVVALDGTSVRLVDVTGAVTVMLTGHLLADPGFELLAGHGRPLPAAGLADRLPGEVRASARWWERHVVEVLTGLPPDAPAGSAPHPDYDPARRSLRQRELAKHAALAAAGHKVGLSTLKRLRRRYELQGLPGLVDQRLARAVFGGPPGGRTDPRVLEATRRAIAEQTGRSTGTVTRLRRRVEQLLAGEADPPQMPSRASFYRLVAALSAGKHTVGSARTRRSLANQPEGPFGTVTAARPGEWTEIDSTPLDVRVVLDDGTVDRVELTGLVDHATRTIAAAVLRPSTKAVDAALLLARALTPEPMRPGWADALRLTRSVLPYPSLTGIDERLEHAAARPVIVPETIVCDHGKAYLSATFRAACRSLGISLAPAHPHTPTDKPVVERTLGSVSTLFAQHVAGYVGRSAEHRGKDAEAGAAWSMTELQSLLDEWIVAVWQNRPHDGLRDPLTPGQALTPNERYAALVAVAGYVPVPLGPEDYIELLPVTWRVINSYGVKVGLRTYDSRELNPYRRQDSGIKARHGRWEVRHDPYDISRIWIRNHHHGGWLSATWTHLRTGPVPFGELIWAHARQIVAARSTDPVTEAEIAAAAADLLDRAGQGPGPGSSGQAPVEQQQQPEDRRRSSRSRRIAGRTAATAAPQWPRPAPGPDGGETDAGPPGQAGASGPGPGADEPTEQPAGPARSPSRNWSAESPQQVWRRARGAWDCRCEHEPQIRLTARSSPVGCPIGPSEE